jgi:DNA (cytosine-5)-methyltransferase 1
MSTPIPVIDLFAGPGGLGEGFSRFRPDCDLNGRAFQIGLSVEMDHWAHQTLELRSFFRQFDDDGVPEDYYRYLRGQIERDDLFRRHPAEAQAARGEAMHAELGSEDNIRIDRAITRLLRGQRRKPWVLIGGPPCQAYSTIGRARRRANGTGREAFEEDKRHFLYQQYLRILAEYRPPVFVMENVTGLLSSHVRGENIFNRIRSDLSQPLTALSTDPRMRLPNRRRLEYHIHSLVVPAENPDDLRPADFIIRSEEFGVPQARHRVILLGVRSDLHVLPGVLIRRADTYGVRHVLADLPPIRSALSREEDSDEAWLGAVSTLGAEQWLEQLNIVRPQLNGHTRKLRTAIARTLQRLPDDLTTGAAYIRSRKRPAYLREWFHDERLKGVCNHVARAHMRADLHRYLYAACFVRACGISPRMCDYPPALWPEHQNVQLAIDGDVFDDRFRVQQADRPATTITSHIAKDGHYNIHYDARQCRSLTVREAARIQTFPDNYLFEGPRTQQYRQVGNAVPPLLARQIAEVVFGMFEDHGAD